MTRASIVPSGDGRNQQPAASPRDLADLARAGYVMLRQPLMQVTFEVHHVTDRPGYLAEYVARAAPSDGSDGAHGFGETLTSSADGMGLVIVTRTGVGAGSYRQYKSGGQMQCEVDDCKESRIFRGTARPNPTFIYESAWRYEGLICVDPRPARMRRRHSHSLRDVIHEVAKLAKSYNAPILSLQAPAQVPVTGQATTDQEEDLLPAASSIAVRFAIALQRPEAATILALSERLARFCTGRGFGLWVADTRLGARSGNWFRICESDRGLGMTRSPARSADSGQVTRCLPVTFVGPARVGSTYALVSFLRQFSEIGIFACSITSLDDLAFIHLELSFADAQAEDLQAVDETFDAAAYSAKRPSDALIAVLQLLGSNQLGDHQRAGSLLSNAGDYQCLVGRSRPVVTGAIKGRMAIWFSWQTQGGEVDLAIPLSGLLGALEEVGLLHRSPDGRSWDSSAPNIEYLVCRSKGNSIFRGKGKLSVPRDPSLQRYPADGLEPRPTDLCVSIEEAWRARTVTDGLPGVSDLTVTWREGWLGHWSMPI